MKKEIASLRQHYDRFSLRRADLETSPLAQFEKWFREALEMNVLEPNAMSLATANEAGIPSVRIVLLKDFDELGFRFYTNYGSQKSLNMMKNNHIEVVFNWLEAHRQVRISGIAEKISRNEAEAYFQSRPRESQIGAYASQQSQVISNRQQLDDNAQAMSEKFATYEKIPMPDNWGGWLLKPNGYEFWQGRPSRLHDRFRYSLQGDTWLIERLSP